MPIVQITINDVTVDPASFAHFTLHYDPAVSPEFAMFGDGSVRVGDQDAEFEVSASGDTDPVFSWRFGLGTSALSSFTRSVRCRVPAAGGRYDRVTASEA